MALWRRVSAFDRVVFVVIDALRSARVQVIFGFPSVGLYCVILIFSCETGSRQPLEKLSDAV
jgi:hypothetical protein